MLLCVCLKKTGERRDGVEKGEIASTTGTNWTLTHVEADSRVVSVSSSITRYAQHAPHIRSHQHTRSSEPVSQPCTRCTTHLRHFFFLRSWRFISHSSGSTLANDGLRSEKAASADGSWSGEFTLAFPNVLHWEIGVFRTQSRSAAWHPGANQLQCWS